MVRKAHEMTKETQQTTTRRRLATAMLAAIAAAIPVTAIAPASAAPGIGQLDRAGGSVVELSSPAPPPPNLWTPNGCSNRNCRHRGQDNHGCNGNSNHTGTNRSGCGNTPSNGGTGNRPSTANAMTAI